MLLPFIKMTYNQIFLDMRKNNIPLADIKVIFDGCFHVDFDRLGIIGEEEGPLEYPSILKKLMDGYPAYYLAGYIDILSLHIFLNEDTLIPRTETEDFIYTYLSSHHDLSGKKVLDLCTGSGFIALAIKKLYPESIVDASDISENALKAAQESADYNQLKIHFIKSDFFNDIQNVYDIIICNPPYIEEGSKDVDAPFEHELALYSGKDGLDSYRSIFKELKKHLTKNGTAYFEMESTNVKNTISLLKKLIPEADYEVIEDCYQRQRYLKVSF